MRPQLDVSQAGAAAPVAKQKRRRVGHDASAPKKRVRLDLDPANTPCDGSNKFVSADELQTINADPDTSRQEPASSSSSESDWQRQRRTPQSDTDSIECTIQFWGHEISFVRFRMPHYATFGSLKQKVAARTFGGVKVKLSHVELWPLGQLPPGIKGRIRGDTKLVNLCCEGTRALNFWLQDKDVGQPFRVDSQFGEALQQYEAIAPAEPSPRQQESLLLPLPPSLPPPPQLGGQQTRAIPDSPRAQAFAARDARLRAENTALTRQRSQQRHAPTDLDPQRTCSPITARTATAPTRRAPPQVSTAFLSPGAAMPAVVRLRTAAASPVSGTQGPPLQGSRNAQQVVPPTLCRGASTAARPQMRQLVQPEEVDDEMHDVEMHTPAGAQISAPSVAGQAGARHMGSYRPDAENLPPPVEVQEQPAVQPMVTPPSTKGQSSHREQSARWQLPETQRLIQGVVTCGAGRWGSIAQEFDLLPWHALRPTALKDRWRNIVKNVSENKSCRGCKLTPEDIQRVLSQLPGWQAES